MFMNSIDCPSPVTCSEWDFAVFVFSVVLVPHEVVYLRTDLLIYREVSVSVSANHLNLDFKQPRAMFLNL